MKTIIQDIGEMTDSRELLESKIPPFMSIFIYFIITLIITGLIWSYFGEIDDYVTANGTVRLNEKISTIKNSISGKVESIYLEEGKKVQKNDLLYTIEHKNLDVEKNTLEKELQKNTTELINLKKFKNSLIDNTNYFNKDIATENDYYNKYLKYVIDTDIYIKTINDSKVDLEQTSQDFIFNKKNTQIKIDEIKRLLENLQNLDLSIQKKQNLFIEINSEYFKKFEDYMFNIKKFEAIVFQTQEQYNRYLDYEQHLSVTHREVIEVEDLFKSAKLELEKYKNEYLMNLHSSIKEKQDSLTQLDIELSKVERSITLLHDKKHDSEITLQKNKVYALVELDANMDTIQNNIDKIEKDIETVNINIEQSTVKSTIAGTLNILSEINIGDSLQSGTDVATIIPKDDSKYKIQLYVSNTNIAKIKNGNSIRYHFSALPYREYGELTGIISNIGIDSKVNQETGNSFYVVEATVENKPLYSYKGIKSEIKVGMTCEAQFITGSKKVLYFILEKLNLKD